MIPRLRVALRVDNESAWVAFRAVRARYEPLLAVLGRMTDAPQERVELRGLTTLGVTRLPCLRARDGRPMPLPQELRVALMAARRL